MSWSVQLTGVPDRMAEELDRYETSLSGQSLTEFSEAKLHLQALLKGNVGQSGLLQLNANGNGIINNGVKTYGSLSVTLQTFAGKVCT